ncbi:MAG: flavodoxin family protein [Nitrososphaeria archaeon]
MVDVLKGVVLYDTSYGNTQRVAEAIADGLRERGHEVGLYHIKEAGRLSAEDYDFVVVGSPTKMGTMSFAMRRFLGKFKDEGWMGKPFFAFDTELVDVIEKGGVSAGEKIQKELEEKGMRPLAPVLKAGVGGTKGPLVSTAIEKARKHAWDFADMLV